MHAYRAVATKIPTRSLAAVSSQDCARQLGMPYRRAGRQYGRAGWGGWPARRPTMTVRPEMASTRASGKVLSAALTHGACINPMNREDSAPAGAHRWMRRSAQLARCGAQTQPERAAPASTP